VHNAVLLPATRAKLRAIHEKWDRELAQASSPEERHANREACKR